MTIKSTIDAQHLQQDIDKVSMWKGKYKIPFHPDKSNILFVIGNKILIKLNSMVINPSH
jgi:hypothetical protein